MSSHNEIRSRHKLNKNLDEPRKLYRNKEFYVQPTTQQETTNKRTIFVATIRFSVVIETTKESMRYLS